MVEVFGLISMDEGVVVAAEETEVVEDCLASVCPEDDVMNVAPSSGSAASAVCAVAVSCDDGLAETGGDDSCFPADIENLGFWTKNDSADGCVTGELTDGVDAENVTCLCFV